MFTNDLQFITNNVKGIQSAQKRLKIFEHLKSKISPSGVMFLQETHSTIKDEKRWADEFKGKMFFSHGTSNSCGVAIGYFGSKAFVVKSELSDNHGRILLLNVKIDNQDYILINLYNANTEKEQLNT